MSDKSKKEPKAYKAKLSDFKSDSRNLNQHTQRGRGIVEASMRQRGFARPGFATKEGVVLGGNLSTMDVAADIELGEGEVFVVESDGSIPIIHKRTDVEAGSEEAVLLAAEDNRSAEVSISWDAELLAEEINQGVDFSGVFYENELEEILQGLGIETDEPLQDVEPRIDRAEDLRQEYGVELGQVWQLGPHRVVCGDCTDKNTMSLLMGAAMGHMVWTDPPYGVSVGDKNVFLNSIGKSNRIEKNIQNGTLDEDGLYKMLCCAFDNLVDICSPGSAFYVAAPPGPLHILFGKVLKDRGIWRQTIQWVKNNATFSPLGVDYHWQSEPIFYGWEPSGAHRFYGGRKQTTVWEIDRPLASPLHPTTTKPVELVARAIENSSREGEICIDSFLGSGTTLLAAHQLNRICYGVEIDPRYVAVTLHRFKELTSIEPELVGS